MSIRTVLPMLLLLAAAGGTASAQQSAPPVQAEIDQLKARPWSVTVITAADIERSTAATVAEVVRGAAGLVVADEGSVGAVKTIGLRGSGPAQVRVLLDGIPLNSPRDGVADVSSLPLALKDVERIEIMRAPTSAVYGADAIGGVVNIITRSPDASDAQTSGVAGSHGYDSLDARTASRYGASFYALSGSRETSDGYRRNSDLEKWTVHGKLGYDIEKGTTLEISGNYIGKELGSPGSTISYESPNARQRERTTALSSALTSKLAGGVDMKISAFRNDDLLRFQDPDSHLVTLPTFSYTVAPISGQQRSVSTGGEVQVNWRAADWTLFTAGHEIKKDRLESTDLGEHQTTNDAWYLQDEISAGRSLVLVIGQRRDTHSIYGSQNSTRAGIRYLLADSTILRLSYGESFRAPTFDERYRSAPSSVGDPDLRPERGVQYETGIEQLMGAGNWIKVSGFRRKVKDLINWSPKVFPLTPENRGRAEIKGAEGEIQLSAPGGVLFAVTYTYLKAIDETTNDKIYSTLYPRNKFGGRVVLPVDKDVSLTVEGHSVENYVLAGDPVWRYSVYDAKIAQKIGKKRGPKGELYFAMTNIFDRNYESVQGYPMPPKEIRGGVTLPF